MSLPLFSGKQPLYRLNRWPGRPWGQSRRYGEEICVRFLPEFEIRIIQPVSYSGYLLAVGRPYEGREPLIFGHIRVKDKTGISFCLFFFLNQWLQRSNILSLCEVRKPFQGLLLVCERFRQPL